MDLKRGEAIALIIGAFFMALIATYLVANFSSKTTVTNFAGFVPPNNQTDVPQQGDSPVLPPTCTQPACDPCNNIPTGYGNCCGQMPTARLARTLC